jgi:hypothetical protein
MRDSDIARLLNTIKINPGRQTYGNEASQLEATIKYCVTAEDLRNFLISEAKVPYGFKERYEFW